MRNSTPFFFRILATALAAFTAGVSSLEGRGEPCEGSPPKNPGCSAGYHGCVVPSARLLARGTTGRRVMAKNGFRVMDSDIHVIEPRDVWVRYMEPAFRDQAPRFSP